jgi:pantoate--beta-alanine ligase
VQHLTVLDTIPGFRAALDVARADGHVVGFVPTMGYLHDGHRSLLDAAREDCDVVAVSIFVNPLQFGAGEDLAAYPRDLDRDLRLCADAGADWAFVPEAAEMYPGGTPTLTTVAVAGVSEPMEGAHRPTHFAGVATVVAKLFAIVGISRAYFGEKDWQQLAVVRRMAADLSFPVEVIGCPTVREDDGLALSSRNT